MYQNNMPRADIELGAPAHGSRRRSSMLAKQMLDAIRETEDETFDEILRFDFLALGGGVAAGYWAQVCVMIVRPIKQRSNG